MGTAVYVRVSTPDQPVDRQIDKCSSYARNRLDTAVADLDVYRDKSTGTDTDRSGYQSLVADATDGEIDTVVVASISRISRSIRDLDRTVDRLADHGVALHIVSEGLVLDPDEDDPYQDALFRMLGVFAQLEAEMTQQRVREGITARQQNDDYHHGPAPIGFSKDSGQLVPSDRHDRVVAVLEMVQKRELSKRQAAKELDCSRPTINRALDRPELYGL